MREIATGHCGGRIRLMAVTALGVVLTVFLIVGVPVAGALSCGPSSSSPTVGFGGIRAEAATQTSLGPFLVEVEPNGSETDWEMEWSESKDGPWTLVPGGSGTISGSAGQTLLKTSELKGLLPETSYFVRLRMQNGCLPDFEEAKEFETVSAIPIAEPVSVSKVTGASAHVADQILTKTHETHWRFEYSTSQATLEAGNGTVGPQGVILASDASEDFSSISGELTGLSPSEPAKPTLYYVRVVVENEPQPGEKKTGISPIVSFETGGKPQAGTFAVHGFHGDQVRLVGSVVPHGNATEYYFEYVTQEAFEASEWDNALHSAVGITEPGEFRAGFGFPTIIVGEDATGIEGGKTYDYRLVAVNQDGISDGNMHTFAAPTVIRSSGTSCPNAGLRLGLSARLPDCRAYEQVTPPEKGGTMDIDSYGNVPYEVLVGADGNHVFLHAPGTQWGTSPDAKISSYVFSRTESSWGMTSITSQPGAGGNSYTPDIFNPDLTEVDLEVGWATTPSNSSSSVELERGRTGGPYNVVASVPRGDVITAGEWIAMTPDGSKSIIRSGDRDLAGGPTGTHEGEDLYEVTNGEISQLNVLTGGEAIGTCGATLVRGFEGFQQEGEIASGNGNHVRSSPHSMSVDGKSVFFEAVPGKDCSASTHLYMRLNGAETIDVGKYQFLAATADGTQVLLDQPLAEGQSELLLYEAGSQTIVPLFKLGIAVEASDLVVSDDMSTFYLRAPERLVSEAPPLSEGSQDLGESAENFYRYDVHNRELKFLFQAGTAGQEGGGYLTSPDGRFLYFVSQGIGGVPGGGKQLNGGVLKLSNQVYRYDANENLVACISCTSSSNPEPKLGAYFLYGKDVRGDGVPEMNVASENGGIVFFDTTAQLVPQDVDGEIAPNATLGSEYVEFDRSPSSDTYEWRNDGVDGCETVEGCLSLVSSGTGGYRNELLGTTRSGNDVFFATHDSLVGQDKDTAGDIYDARVDGGYPPPPPPPVECENSACSTPTSLPNDVTPASFAFSGAESVVPRTKQPAGTKAKSVPKRKPLKCRKGKRRRAGKCVKIGKSKSRARKSASHTHGRGR